MKFAFTAYGPIVANGRMGAAKMANGLIEEIEKRTGQKFILTIHGPIDHDRTSARDEGGPEAGAGSGLEGPHPGDDFREDGAEDDGLQHDRDREAGGDDAPAEPKRGRGRPRKHRDGDDGEASRSAAEGPERGRGPERARGAAEGSGRDGARGTAEGEREGRGDRAEGAREPGERAPAAAGGRGGDQIQAGVMADVPDDGGMDFNDPEPEAVLTMADINKALTRLFGAMGKGASKAHIGKALSDISGVTQPRDVPEEGYAKVIRDIDALTEKYASGKLKLA